MGGRHTRRQTSSLRVRAVAATVLGVTLGAIAAPTLVSADPSNHVFPSGRVPANVSVTANDDQGPHRPELPDPSTPLHLPGLGPDRLTRGQQQLLADDMVHRQELAELARKAARKARRLDREQTAAAAPVTFRVASFNVLGDSHTGPGGNKPGMADAGPRMATAVNLLRGQNVDVVGFQEFETSQYNMFKGHTGDEFGVFPGPSLGRNSIRNSIAWRNDTWTLVSSHTISIPYFSGNRVAMPYVLLEHQATGRQVYFINIHNPASTKNHPGNQGWRNAATGLEIGLVNRLRNETGLPVVLTGDFNERSEAFCRITGQASMVASNGGDLNGGCHLPPGAGIDWIFGTAEHFTFGNYVRQDNGASDHPIIVADATVSGTDTTTD